MASPSRILRFPPRLVWPPSYHTCAGDQSAPELIHTQRGIVLGARLLLGDKLPRDIFVEHAADQGVIGYSLPGGTVFEGLEVHLRESNGQALRFRQCLAGRLLQGDFVW